MVKVGQTVRRGQVLIKGEERTADEGVRPVSARGEVKAYVWDAAAVRVSGKGMNTQYTGAVTEMLNVECPWFSLCRQREVPYASYDRTSHIIPLGGLFIPLTIRKDTCFETQMSPAVLEPEQIRAQASTLAMQKLREKIGLEDILIDKWVDMSTIDDGELQAVAYAKRIVDIGVRDDQAARP